MDHHNLVPRFLKVGKLHSPSNLKLRAQYFEQKYGECRYAEVSNRTEEDSPIRSITYYQRHSQKGFTGFDFNLSYLKTLSMVKEMIEEQEMLEQFTSDEESTTDEEELEPVHLPLGFNFKQGLTFQGRPIRYRNENGVDDNSSDEEEPIAPRPLSRLSLEVDEKFDESTSEYDSDYFFCESEGEGEDNPQKRVIYGPVPGVPVGTVWRTRRQCSRSSVHVPHKSRIHAGMKAGCSIVLSSQEMVHDEGVLFTYKSKAKLGKLGSARLQTDPSKYYLVGANKALQNNFLKRIPIRVIRGYQLGNAFAPKKGYRYDGLYDVKDIVHGSERNGIQYCEATVVRCPNQPPPPWATNNAPAGDVPGHLLSTTEIDYTTGDESESVLSDNIESIESPCSAAEYPLDSRNRSRPESIGSPCSAAEYLLDSRNRSRPIVVLKRLTAAEIEKATNLVPAPKEPAGKSAIQPRESKKINTRKRSRFSQTLNNTSPILQQKTEVRLQAANKTARGSGSKLDSTNEESSKKLRKDLSKDKNVRKTLEARKSNSSSLKQKGTTRGSYSQKESFLEEDITARTKKMAVERTPNTENKPKKVVIFGREQNLAQSSRGITLRSSGKKNC